MLQNHPAKNFCLLISAKCDKAHAVPSKLVLV